MAVSDLGTCLEPQAEDWRDVSDPKTRRKLQNRQNQRARRLRNVSRGAGPMVKQYIPGPKAGKFVYLLRPDEGEQKDGICQKLSKTTTIPLTSSSNECDTDELLQRLTGEDDKQIRSAMNAIGSSLLIFGGMGGVNLCKYGPGTHSQRGTCIDSDRLLTLLYYNAFRAFTWNVQILGLDLSKMSQEDYPSPFLLTHNSDASATTKLPECLRPTEVQKRVYHHAGFDTLPCPIIRDNMIQHMMSDEEEDELCLDMEGLNRSSHGIGTDPGPYSNLEEGNRSGLTVWGDPWKLESWEISEYVALKHPWLLVGAFEAQMHTNARRRARGWKELHFAYHLLRSGAFIDAAN